jgi:arylsulfatase A-like enzyme
MIHNIDRWLAVFQKELDRRGERENTLIVYCSDHGEMLGDRGLAGKSQPFHPSACVPLVLAGLAIRRNVVCDRPVKTLDLTATFLDFAGITVPKDMDSKSLRPFLEKESPLPKTLVTSSLGNWSLVMDGSYKLVATQRKKSRAAQRPFGPGAESALELVLYDLKSDPAETQDLSGRHRDIIDRLRPFLPRVGLYGDV